MRRDTLREGAGARERGEAHFALRSSEDAVLSQARTSREFNLKREDQREENKRKMKRVYLSKTKKHSTL